MDTIIHHTEALQGTLSVPPDKAICHRAVFIAALAEGETGIRPWPEAEDCQRTLELVQALGVRVRRSSEAVTIQGRGLGGFRAPTQDLFCGESGTTLRLAAGLLAGQSFVSRLTAGASLSRRPMRRIIEPLSRMGARLEGTRSSSDAKEVFPPLTIQGHRPLGAMRYELPVASAQVKSAVLLAGLSADARTTIVEPQHTRDHTERMLRHFGVRVDGEGTSISIEPGALTSPGTLELPGDLSSAAFFLVAASIVPGSQVTMRGVALNPTRSGLLTVLRWMGASLDVEEEKEDHEWEPRGTLTVSASTLSGTTIESSEVPGLIDELPILMVAAACARGPTIVRGVGELRVKETDRVRSMVDGLGRMGAQIHVVGQDSIEIEGTETLQGAAVEGAGDHRTAMSLAVAALVADGATTIRGAECVAKSFPSFFDQLRLLIVSRR